MNVARHISTQAPVRCWWRSFFGTGWVAFLPLAFVLVLVFDGKKVFPEVELQLLMESEFRKRLFVQHLKQQEWYW